MPGPEDMEQIGTILLWIILGGFIAGMIIKAMEQQ